MHNAKTAKGEGCGAGPHSLHVFLQPRPLLKGGRHRSLHLGQPLRGAGGQGAQGIATEGTALGTALPLLCSACHCSAWQACFMAGCRTSACCAPVALASSQMRARSACTVAAACAFTCAASGGGASRVSRWYESSFWEDHYMHLSTLAPAWQPRPALTRRRSWLVASARQARNTPRRSRPSS